MFRYLAATELAGACSRLRVGRQSVVLSAAKPHGSHSQAGAAHG